MQTNTCFVSTTNALSPSAKEGNKGKSTPVLSAPVFKLIERPTENMAANTVLQPWWEAPSKVASTKRALSSTNEHEVASLLTPLAAFNINSQTSSEMGQERVATLLAPFEAFHLSAGSSDGASNENFELLSSVEDDDSDAVTFDSAPDITLKPAVWDEQDLGAEYMDEEEEEEEEDEQIPYTLPSYESVYGVSRPCPRQVYDVGAYQAQDPISRYRYIGKQKTRATSRGRRYVPYTLRTSPPAPKTSPDPSATSVSRNSSINLAVGSIVLARVKELASLGYEPHSQVGTRSSNEEMSRERQDRKRIRAVTHQFGSLVLGV